MNIVNISAYKFIELSELPALRQQLLSQCTDLDLKGTILISPEGINMNLAGTSGAITTFKQALQHDSRFADLVFKESLSSRRPFGRLLVKIKKEIITLRQPEIQPEKATVPHIAPKALKQWLDEGRDITFIDTRNHFEIEYGTFKNALDLEIECFTEFPDAVAELPETLKEKTIVMFCTGGVRCEKAGPVMANQGFKHVYQIDGGILNYFEQCGGEYYEGDCFVFDERVALTPELQPTHD